MLERVVELLVSVKNDGMGKPKTQHNHQKSLGIDHDTRVGDWFGNGECTHTTCNDEETFVASKVYVGANGAIVDM